MNLYATYAYYISTYRGNLTEEEFEKAIIPASSEWISGKEFMFLKLGGTRMKNLP